jgi:hypothetical protein
MLKNFRNSILAVGIATYLLLCWTSPAMAGLVGSALSHESGNSQTRNIHIDKIRRVLENKVVTDRLIAYGLTPDEVKGKINQMSDNQIHMLAQASDNVLAGGDGVGVVIGVLLIILLVIVILKLLNKEIVIR